MLPVATEYFLRAKKQLRERRKKWTVIVNVIIRSHRETLC